MNDEQFRAGDVVWAPDPYNDGNGPRPWMIINGDNLPYQGEEYICAGLTLSNLPANIAVTDPDWVRGNDPTNRSYCSPWVLSTIKHDEIAAPQGYVTAEFTETIRRRAVEYLTGDSDGSVTK